MFLNNKNWKIQKFVVISFNFCSPHFLSLALFAMPAVTIVLKCFDADLISTSWSVFLCLSLSTTVPGLYSFSHTNVQL